MNMVECFTKRSLLSEFAKMYEPIVFVSPTKLGANFLYREICEARISWSETLPETILKMRRERKWSLQGSSMVLVLSRHTIVIFLKYGFTHSEMQVRKKCALWFMRWRISRKKYIKVTCTQVSRSETVLDYTPFRNDCRSHSY